MDARCLLCLCHHAPFVSPDSLAHLLFLPPPPCIPPLHTQVGAWEAASSLCSRLAGVGLQAAAWPPVSDTLAATIASQLQPITSRLVPRGAAGPGLLTSLQAQLTKLGPGAGSAALRGALPQALRTGPPLTQRATDAILALGPFLSRTPALLAQVGGGDGGLAGGDLGNAHVRAVTRVGSQTVVQMWVGGCER